MATPAPRRPSIRPLWKKTALPALPAGMVTGGVLVEAGGKGGAPAVVAILVGVGCTYVVAFLDGTGKADVRLAVGYKVLLALMVMLLLLLVVVVL